MITIFLSSTERIQVMSLSIWGIIYFQKCAIIVRKGRPPPATTWTSVRCSCLPQLGIRQMVGWCRATVGNRNAPMSRWLRGGGVFSVYDSTDGNAIELIWASSGFSIFKRIDKYTNFEKKGKVTRFECNTNDGLNYQHINIGTGSAL